MTVLAKRRVSSLIDEIPNTASVVDVSLSTDLIVLLSDQLYQSPVKAIEELVINSYDAGASLCDVYVPDSINEDSFVIVHDDGIGMDEAGLTNLWQIGRSNKRNGTFENITKRKQIGRFGIGKLATYAVANSLTYITKSDGRILSMTVDFSQFKRSGAANDPISMPVKEIFNWETFLPTISEVLDEANVVIDNTKSSWTIAILENLKAEKIDKLTPPLLNWILSTAMPIEVNFHLKLNGDPIISSKEDYIKVVQFNITDLPQKRLDSIKESTGEEWKVEGNKIVSESFPNGVLGDVYVTDRTLLGNKSDDIARSHGFFIMVRNRLVNTSDPLFVDKALYHGTFNRFRAKISADDLDTELKASREAFEESSLKEKLKSLLKEVFNEANSRYEAKLKETTAKQKKPEGGREIIASQLVERPIADAIIEYASDKSGADANEKWFYLDLNDDIDLSEVANKLYTEPRSKHTYKYSEGGATARLVKFDPSTSTFWINSNHELAIEYSDGHTKTLLEDFATAEALLEVYLREAQVPAHITGQILERRDVLLRSLVKDHAYSLGNIAGSLRQSGADERELEILMVVAARALGFVANHVSNGGEPDGVARFNDYPQGEKKITLEAKSSKDVPSLSAIDFAGLREHATRENAHGCLLVAPSYPGSTKEEDSAASFRAIEQKVSCWTIENLAKFIDSVESRHLNANHLLDIVLNKFAPTDVEAAINKLLEEDTYNYQSLYREVIKAIKALRNKLTDKMRNVSMIATIVTLNPEFENIEEKKIKSAITNLANSSQGGMIIREDNIIINVDIEELERRVAGLTKSPGDSRRLSNFR